MPAQIRMRVHEKVRAVPVPNEHLKCGSLILFVFLFYSTELRGLNEAANKFSLFLWVTD